ncbi:MAG: MarR family winged helix-turn-helix transcriptional regulator [Faecalibacillus sp.]
MTVKYEFGRQIKQIADYIEKHANSHFREQNLTLSQVRYMEYIYHNPKEKVPLKDIETYFKVSQPTVAGIISRMVKKEFVVMERSQDNASAKTVRLTDKGEKAFLTIVSNKDDMEDDIFKLLSPDEAKEFDRILKKINVGLKNT